MRILIYNLLIALTFTPCSQADTQAGSSALYFTGNILARSCDVKTSDYNRVINLGEHERKLFTHTGDVSPSVPLNITLENCQLNPNSTNAISMILGGTGDSADTELLQITTKDGSRTASGVAIEILDNSDQRIALNSDVVKVPMQKGDTPLPTLKLRYRATQDQVTPGEANAILWVTLRYEE
ncbi:fimbrial protein [Citrobacter braakii]|uniref:fimbrial protein n=1 Tax=Citrobacter braakii TaxID=57706 RepID=UPI0030763AAD